MKSIYRFLAFYFFPYPDPLRRRRMRRAALALVTASPWPGDDATPAEIVQLALLRLLRLQREVHRSALVGTFEATLLLARAAVETFIVGLYWLGSDDAGEQLTAANARNLERVIKFLAQAFGVPEGILHDAVLLIGEPQRPPDYRRMSEVLSERMGIELTVHFYDQLYVPLSEAFVHPTGVALLRHVAPSQELTAVPERWWTRRSAVHTVDVCTSHLAFELAKQSEISTEPFADYTMAHAHRMFAPVVTMFVSHAARGIRPSEWRMVLRSRKTFREASAAYGSLTSAEQREVFTKQFLRQFLGQFEFAKHDELLDQLIDVFARWFGDPGYSSPANKPDDQR